MTRNSQIRRTRRLFRQVWQVIARRLRGLWNSHQLIRLLLAMLAVWLTAGTLIHFAERETPGYGRWIETMWNVFLTFFAASPATPETIPGRLLTTLVIVTGVVLAGLFTASVASILIERSLRRREVNTFEMDDHLVLCNWAPRGLEWIKQVHSPIVRQRRPIVIVHDNPEDIDLPDKQDDPTFDDVYIVKGDPINDVVLRRARVSTAFSVVILADDRQGDHADGKTILTCVAVRQLCRGEEGDPNVVAECHNVRFLRHLRRAGADEVIASSEFGLRLLARASLFHGMTRVYQELLTVGRNRNEIYLVPVPDDLIGRRFADAAEIFLRYRKDKEACMLIGVYRGEKMMLNPTGDEAGPLMEGDEMILMSETAPHPDKPLPTEPPIQSPTGENEQS